MTYTSRHPATTPEDAVAALIAQIGYNAFSAGLARHLMTVKDDVRARLFVESIHANLEAMK